MAPKRKGNKAPTHQAKRKKCEVASNQADEIANDAIELTKITDMNNDCLLHIFNYLSFVDLLNLCDASTRFGDVIIEQSRFYSVELTDIRPSRNQSMEVNEINWHIIISDLTTCLKFTRHFGHKIKWLEINYNGITERYCAEVDRYINKYCAGTLKELRIRHAKPYAMNNIKKSFSQVDVVEFENCELSYQLTNFNKWFPDMFIFYYKGLNKIANSKCLSKRIPRLQYLYVDVVTNEEDKCRIGMLQLAEILRSNPNIMLVDISGPGLDAKSLQSVSEDLEKLPGLALALSRHFFNLKRGTIHLKSISTLKINFDSSVVDFPKIPLSFDNLNRLSISSETELNENFVNNFINCIAKHKSLRILSLWGCVETKALKNVVNHVKFKTVLRSLKGLSLNCKFSTDEVIVFLDNYKTIKTFYFALDGTSQLVSLKERLPAEWQDFKNYYDLCVCLSRQNDPLDNFYDQLFLP